DPQWAFAFTLSSGARLVVLDRFRPRELWTKISHYDAVFFYCLAAMPLMLLSSPAEPHERAHRLRVIMCSAIPAEQHRELEERFGVPWLEAYGATETGSSLGVSWTDHARCVGVATIGKPLPHREARIVDDLMVSVEEGEIGELLVRGGAMMTCYWKNPEATREAFHDGWYRTGDLCRRDTDGFYHLVGRKKDMIRRAGENIAAAEVEAVLHQHPAVTLAACVPVPDPLRNEEIKVFLITSQEVKVGELVAFLESRLAGFKIPRFWSFVDSLPMTPSERVAKPRLARDVGPDVFDRQAEAAHIRSGA
ncbi:MAG: putative acyl-CoA ligase, partial [Sphingomonadales bacterium]|nr:putative acyl-CoA ligase [Sphingomonadales bacterium]